MADSRLLVLFLCVGGIYTSVIEPTVKVNPCGTLTIVQPIVYNRNVNVTFTPTNIETTRCYVVPVNDERALTTWNMTNNKDVRMYTIRNLDRSVERIIVRCYISKRTKDCDSVYGYLQRTATNLTGCGLLYMYKRPPILVGDTVELRYMPSDAIINSPSKFIRSWGIRRGDNSKETITVDGARIEERQLDFNHESVLTIRNIEEGMSGNISLRCKTGRDKTTTEVPIFVTMKPSPPKFTDPATADFDNCHGCMYWNIGETLKLTCVARGGTKPVTAKIKVGGIALTTTASEDGEFTSEFIPSNEDNLKEVRCEVMNPAVEADSPLVASGQLFVVIGPKSVHLLAIDPPSELSPFYVYDLECAVLNANHVCDIRVDGVPVIDFSYETKPADGGQSLYHRVTINVTQTDQGRSVYCVAKCRSLPKTYKSTYVIVLPEANTLDSAGTIANTDENRGTSAVWIGVVVGTVTLLLAGVTVLACIVYRKRRKQNPVSSRRSSYVGKLEKPDISRPYPTPAVPRSLTMDADYANVSQRPMQTAVALSPVQVNTKEQIPDNPSRFSGVDPHLALYDNTRPDSKPAEPSGPITNAGYANVKSKIPSQTRGVVSPVQINSKELRRSSVVGQHLYDDPDTLHRSLDVGQHGALYVKPDSARPVPNPAGREDPTKNAPYSNVMSKNQRPTQTGATVASVEVEGVTARNIPIPSAVSPVQINPSVAEQIPASSRRTSDVGQHLYDNAYNSRPVFNSAESSVPAVNDEYVNVMQKNKKHQRKP